MEYSLVNHYRPIINDFMLKITGNQTPINPTVDRLYPTIYFYNPGASVEANFGGNLVTKPFKFDIYKCPGLVFK
jgi:hypothetical protein